MLIPRKVKYRKVHKGRRRFVGKATAGVSLSYGKFGLRADTWHWVTSRQIEAARRAMTRFVKRGGKIWIRVFPDKPITTKGSQSTMGSGKGAVDHYVAVVKPGMILFEMDGIDEATAREALRLAAHKLPVRTTFTAKG